MSGKTGPPKHQNVFAWKPNAGVKINESEVGGKLRPLSEITGVCVRCREQIDWKRRYGKYKGLKEPAKCQGCSKRNVRQAYHMLCYGCAKEQKVCAKCRCQVGRLVGRDIVEVEAEQKALEEAIQNARERERRTLLRAVNKAKANASSKNLTNGPEKVGELFPDATLEEYAARNTIRSGNGNSVSVKHDPENEEDADEYNDDSEEEAEDEDDDNDNEVDDDNDNKVDEERKQCM